MKKIDKRKEYWDNNYFYYWKDRVDKNSINPLAKTDIHPPDEKIFKKYFEAALVLQSGSKKKILDVGVGFGRFIPIYRPYFDNNIWGIDIADQMVEEAKKIYPALKKHFYISSAESLPFPDNMFSFVLCWEVFDATFQDQTLWEFQRILEPGGIVLVTGKNNNYIPSDEKAYIAEVNARKKGHPNFFTDTKLLMENINDFGFKIEQFSPFKLRDDFSKNKVAPQNSKAFYQYVLIMKKVKNTSKQKLAYRITDKYSKTYQNKNMGAKQ